VTKLRRTGRENLVALAVISILRGAHSSLFNVLWQPFVLSLGMSIPVMGLLGSLGGGAGIIGTVAQSLGGRLADGMGRRPLLAAGGIASLASYGLFWIAGAAVAWPAAAAGALLIGLASLARPAMSSMTAESVRTGRHGTAFSLTVVANTLPGILLPAAGGWLAQEAGYTPIFPICVALELCALVVIWLRTAETVRPTGAAVTRGRPTSLLASFLPPPSLWRFGIATASDMLFWGVGWGILFGMLVDAHRFGPAQLGLLAATMSVAWVVVQLPIGRYLDSRPTLPTLIVSQLLGVPIMLIYMTQAGMGPLLLAQALMGFAAATWAPGANTYIARKTSTSERAEAFGRISAFRGLVAFPAAAVGGLLYGWFGLVVPLAVNLVGIFVTVALLKRCPLDFPVQTVEPTRTG
jgi:MFS family permease